MEALDLSRIEAGLSAVFPSLDIPSPLSVIGSGFNSTVIDAGETVVFRIGKNQLAQEGYAKEAICLSVLAPHLPCLIPLPKRYVKSSEYFPFGVIVYGKLPGFPLPPNAAGTPNMRLLAVDTAKFLSALQRISPDSLSAMCPVDHASKWEVQYQEVLPVLRAELASAEFQRIEQWWHDFLADRSMQKYSPVVQHGDLWYENLLVDADLRRLIAVIDWERLSIGDPAQDFATLLHSGEDFVKTVIAAYRAIGGKLDENFEYRMGRLWEAREFDGLQYAVRFNDPVERRDAIQKLRRGPILNRIA